LIAHSNAVNGTVTTKVLATTQMDFANATLHSSENTAKTRNVLMTALEKDFVINQKESAFATTNGMEMTALRKNAQITVQEMVNVLTVLAYVLMISMELIALKRIARITAIHMASAKMENVTATRASLENTANTELVPMNAISREYAKKMEFASVTKDLQEAIVLLLTALTIAIITDSAEITHATVRINGQVLTVQKSLVHLIVLVMESVSKEFVTVRMGFWEELAKLLDAQISAVSTVNVITVLATATSDGKEKIAMKETSCTELSKKELLNATLDGLEKIVTVKFALMTVMEMENVFKVLVIASQGLLVRVVI
jgi:predicted glutamine amidotransferase